MEKLNIKFQATLETNGGEGAWIYVVWDGVEKTFGTRRAVKVKGTIDGEPFQSSFLPVKDGTHLLGVNAKTRKAISKDVGDSVAVALTERV